MWAKCERLTRASVPGRPHECFVPITKEGKGGEEAEGGDIVKVGGRAGGRMQLTVAAFLLRRAASLAASALAWRSLSLVSVSDRRPSCSWKLSSIRAAEFCRTTTEYVSNATQPRWVSVRYVGEMAAGGGGPKMEREWARWGALYIVYQAVSRRRGEQSPALRCWRLWFWIVFRWQFAVMSGVG